MPVDKQPRWWRDNSLTLALLSVFALAILGQAISGFSVENQSRGEHGAAALSFASYLISGAFLSSVFENWESEFLQMWAYVMLTAYLFQRGSPESKDPDETAPQDRDPYLDRNAPSAPWPVRAGAFARGVYAHSLGLAMLSLFLLSFALHYLNSARAQIEDARLHGEPAPSLLSYGGDPQVWFESFQNWQSEFLSTARPDRAGDLAPGEGIAGKQTRGGAAWGHRNRLTGLAIKHCANAKC